MQIDSRSSREDVKWRPSRSIFQPGSLPKIEELARSEGIPVEQFLFSAAAEKVMRSLGEDYLEQRARRSSPEAFRRALAQVPDVPPDPGDEL